MQTVLGIPNPLSKPYWRLVSRSYSQAYRQCLQELESHQRWSPQKVSELQWRKLQALVEHAYDHVPYYRQMFDTQGIKPPDIRVPRDYERLPVLTKALIQKNLEQLVARDLDRDKLIENHTGGSTGQPLTFYQDINYRRYASAGLSWGFQLCGFQPGDKQVFLWGSDYDSKDHRGWKARSRDWIKNVLWINVFELTENSLVEAARLLSKWQPDFVWGYTTSVEMLAKVIQKYGIRNIRPKGIQLTAEVVTQVQREFIEETLRCRVFNRYGCREVGLIAHECSAHSGLHIVADNNYVECVQDGRPAAPGEEGSIIVTNLNNFSMPLLRYEIGDMGIPSDGSCECGRGYPLMKVAKGRLVDIIVSPSGKLLHGEFFTHLFYKTRGVQQFQVIQESKRDLEIKIVKGDGFSEETLRSIEQAIRTFGDADFEVHFEMCDQIPLSASGKYRFTMSKVSAL